MPNPEAQYAEPRSKPLFIRTKIGLMASALLLTGCGTDGEPHPSVTEDDVCGKPQVAYMLPYAVSGSRIDVLTGNTGSKEIPDRTWGEVNSYIRQTILEARTQGGIKPDDTLRIQVGVGYYNGKPIEEATNEARQISSRLSQETGLAELSQGEAYASGQEAAAIYICITSYILRGVKYFPSVYLRVIILCRNTMRNNAN